jgi:D-3-phosphoglycerate dehydrogenase
VVVDVDADASKLALENLCDVEGTIRCRVLY